MTLKEIAREVGLEESLVQRACVDRTMDEDDPAHQEWLKNLKDAEKLGELIFGFRAETGEDTSGGTSNQILMPKL